MGISAIALDGARQPAGAFENDKAEDASLIVELSSIFRTGIKRPRTASLASEKQEAVASASGRPGSNRPKLYSHPESTDPDPAPAYPVSIKQRVVKASSEPVKKTEDKDEVSLQVGDLEKTVSAVEEDYKLISILFEDSAERSKLSTWKLQRPKTTRQSNSDSVNCSIYLMAHALLLAAGRADTKNRIQEGVPDRIDCFLLRRAFAALLTSASNFKSHLPSD
ncbi:hypothetical protein VSDG_09520 [Cytospora chrysosperma]|uniref:Uncharacterized protein n=1 Tax=Cytospora chrysosperma TaxID=252740 RepID=A0A423VCI6_CYTCH|nr:hypothetical protein VSDG_09520 [Valsa sordida]